MGRGDPLLLALALALLVTADAMFVIEVRLYTGTALCRARGGNVTCREGRGRGLFTRALLLAASFFVIPAERWPEDNIPSRGQGQVLWGLRYEFSKLWLPQVRGLAHVSGWTGTSAASAPITWPGLLDV